MATQHAISSATMTHWLASVRWTSGNSTARGDNLFGSGNYTSDGACPNGLTWRNPEGCRAARKAQIDRARKFREEWDADIAAAALVADFDAAEVQQVLTNVWREVYDDGTGTERSG